MRTMPRWIFAVATLFCLAGHSFAQAPPNFSGEFQFVPANASEAAIVVTLEIKQTATAIQIPRTVSGKPNVENYTLDGSAVEWNSSTGIPMKASASGHGSELWLDSLATLPVNGHTEPLHSTEKWELSKDGGTITIRTELVMTNMPSGGRFLSTITNGSGRANAWSI